MTIALDSAFVAAAQRTPYEVIFGEDRRIIVQNTSAVTGGPFSHAADLEVLEDGDVVGYITPYGESERGAVPSNLFGRGAPKIVNSLDAALREVLG